MNHVSRVVSTLVLLVTSFNLGCSEDPEGTPPTISNLSLVPMTLTAGQQNAVTGTLAFLDPEADVVDLGMAIELPDGSRQTPPLADVGGSTGKTEGTVQIDLTIVPPAAGTYRFELWLEDAGGGTSNRLQASAQAH